jgi:hypothetical protein
MGWVATFFRGANQDCVWISLLYLLLSVVHIWSQVQRKRSGKKTLLCGSPSCRAREVV